MRSAAGRFVEALESQLCTKDRLQYRVGDTCGLEIIDAAGQIDFDAFQMEASLSEKARSTPMV